MLILRQVKAYCSHKYRGMSISKRSWKSVAQIEQEVVLGHLVNLSQGWDFILDLLLWASPIGHPAED